MSKQDDYEEVTHSYVAEVLYILAIVGIVIGEFAAVFRSLP